MLLAAGWRGAGWRGAGWRGAGTAFAPVLHVDDLVLKLDAGPHVELVTVPLQVLDIVRQGGVVLAVVWKPEV